MLNLDTHMLVFALNGELRPAERALLAQNRWSVAAIVLWELAKLIDLGRIDMDLDDRDVSRVLNRIQIWPLDLAVARASARLDLRVIQQTNSLPPPVSCTTFRCSRATASYVARRSSPWPFPEAAE